MSLAENQQKAQKAANEYAEARAKLEKDRLRAWSSAPGLKIGNFAVYPLSLQSMIDLELEENAFFTGSQILNGDIAAYIWRHMPEYDRSDPNYEKNLKRFIRKIAKETNPAKLVTGIQNHIETAFVDDPTVVRFGGTSKRYTMSPIPGVAAICHEYGSTYGVDPVEVSQMDLRIVFQCCRAIRISQGEAKFSEPEPLLRAKSKYLKAKNG